MMKLLTDVLSQLVVVVVMVMCLIVLIFVRWLYARDIVSIRQKLNRI